MKNSVDFHKIAKGSQGVINFNNMIPIPEPELILIDINGIEDVAYKNLLNAQIKFINTIQERLKEKAANLYHLVNAEDTCLSSYEVKIKKRCVDFVALQEKVLSYRS